jgi:hypothetical protein
MITIERKTDFVALAAFLLALVSCVTQCVSSMRGARVAVLGPDRVVLYSDVAPGGQPIVRIGAPLAYANTAEQSYGAILARETVILSVGGVTTQQVWNSFGTLGRANGQETVTSSAPATPQTISGQSVSSHVTLFAPLLHECSPRDPACTPTSDYVTPKTLSHQLQLQRPIHLQFESHFFGGDIKRYACDVAVTIETVQRWLSTGIMYVRCQERRLY